MPAAKATRIELFRFDTPAMRAFHLTWAAFFCCFFAWFGIAPLMTVVRADLGLNKDQVGWCIIASVAATVLARLVIGWLCDRIGPRLAYTGLLIVGSLPVMGIGLAYNFESFLFCRLLIGMIGASFVITQYHTSAMFAPNCVGTANAAAAGWGNLGGGVTQIAMPLLFGLLAMTLGLGDRIGWRIAMFVAGLVCLLMAVAYYALTQDTPAGNFAELRKQGLLPSPKTQKGSFLAACRDWRVWALAVAYAACFGVELTMDNVAHMYFVDAFGLSIKSAGLAAGAFGLMNIFARALGGYIADWCGQRWQFRGRVVWLFVALLCEGLALVLFSQMRRIELAIPAMLLAGLFVKMSNGATYSVVPFINAKALGSVAGIVGAGGNIGAVSAGFLFRGSAETWATSFLVLGCAVAVSSLFVLTVRGVAEPAAVPETAPEGSFVSANATAPAGIESAGLEAAS
ncbi:MAG: MFS transporter [Planctomycetaceae bacterium]|nr:MFS transporter [Planctomycetaceae bacterium]